jgi:putative ABC transport system ATP-binding protein
MEIIKKIAIEHHQTIVMVTHDANMAKFANKIIKIHDGQIIEIMEENNNEKNN